MVDTASLETSSDETLVDFDGDGVGELSIGRLPARTLAQAETMTHKIVNYHPGNGGAVFAADHNFEAVNQAARNFLPTGLAVTEINRNGLDDDAMRSQIVNAFNAGPSIVQYAGHGSVEVWTGAGVLNGQSINSLTNYKALPLVVAMTCLNGYFHSPTSESLAERLLNAPNGGGVAVWASSGLTMTTGQTPMDRALFRFLYQNGDAPRLGDAARQAKRATTDSEVRRTWTLFGDPTMILR